MAVGLDVLNGPRYASVVVLNGLGQTVASLYKGVLTEGDHQWRWCGGGHAGAASGVYFILDTHNRSAGVARAVLVH